MNAHVKPAVDTQRQQREFVLAALRATVKRIELIREEIVLTGVALSSGAIDPQTAVKWCEDAAPGCLPAEINATLIAKGWALS